MPLSKLREFLDRNNVKYLVISHATAYTAQGIAAVAHVSGNALAKTVMVQTDGRLAMAVVPAATRVDLVRLKKYLGTGIVELASEADFRSRFADCEMGAMPPFGNLYGMAVFADESLSRDREITFSAGTGRQLVRMNYTDFRDLVRPVLLPLVLAKAKACGV